MTSDGASITSAIGRSRHRDRQRASRGRATSGLYAASTVAPRAVRSPRWIGPDLDAIERDLADVETALARLDDGTYWTDEVTGAPIPDAVLDEHPAARRAGGSPAS